MSNSVMRLTLLLMSPARRELPPSAKKLAFALSFSTGRCSTMAQASRMSSSSGDLAAATAAGSEPSPSAAAGPHAGSASDLTSILPLGRRGITSSTTSWEGTIAGSSLERLHAAATLQHRVQARGYTAKSVSHPEQKSCILGCWHFHLQSKAWHAGQGRQRLCEAVPQTVLSLTLSDAGTYKTSSGCLANQYRAPKQLCWTQLTLRYSQIGVSCIQVNVGR